MEFTNPIVLLTDFGLHDRFVASMKGVIFQVSPQIPVFDLTHQVTPFHVLEAADILAHTLPHWPANTLFVAVVDPGVGTARKALAFRCPQGHTIMAPDNGLAGYALARQEGLVVREIDPEPHRRPGSQAFHTFHGRDLFAYVAACMAAGRLTFEALGPLTATWETLQVPPAYTDARHNLVYGAVIRAERPYGNLVTNIPTAIALPCLKENGLFSISIGKPSQAGPIWQGTAMFQPTFGKVPKGDLLLYPDSNGCLGIAMNQGDLAGFSGVASHLHEALTLAISPSKEQGQ